MKVWLTGNAKLGTPYVVIVFVEVRVTLGEESVTVVVMVENPRVVATKSD